MGIAAPLHQTERTLSTLRKLNLLDKELELTRNEKEIVIPLTHAPSQQDIAAMKEQNPDVRLQEHLFRELPTKPRNLPESMLGKIPEHLLSTLPRSYDIIGDVAIVNLSEDLIQFSSHIGRGVLEVNPQLRLVLRKSGEVTGPFRTRKFEIIAGSGSTETFHKEFSCIFHLDIAKVYFNPRLSHERMRVARQVKPCETVLDMFAGVGPYSILIAKKQLTSRVNATDINAEAFRYLKENTFINGVADRVVPIFEDARAVSPRMLGSASRVVMNLPSEAANFLQAAAQAVAAEGMIHYYTFASRTESLNAIKDSLLQTMRAHGREVRSFPFCEIIREIAPNRVQVAVDILLK
jgi:tRNA (guanine37-N1)-methyltransferase